jgi:nucleoside-diphosphate-sugar epimerase
MKVTIVGANGFVGSAFVRHFAARGVECVGVTRANYEALKGTAGDVLIDAACNSKKFLAEERPFEEFDLSVTHRLRTLRDFPAAFHIHISSVDVYSDLTSPATTREDALIDPATTSFYGLHKLLAEQIVRKYAARWLVVRLAGMVGPGLRKNPVHDILRGEPLRIHPDSQYQFLHTDWVAEAVGNLLEKGVQGELLNVCGSGLISPREIAALAGRELDLSALPAGAAPRIVHVSNEKLRSLMSVPETRDTVGEFVRNLCNA